MLQLQKARDINLSSNSLSKFKPQIVTVVLKLVSTSPVRRCYFPSFALFTLN